ncbi:MAG TPA: hypothetical protein PKE26_01335 [Kiritimatiellia bacterium]|nr:hypothetical protein [Kiritimatiellia bacterium]HMO97735.1 hypothetical protein [Kiritimatiellia bacterium]HMP95374.1 hypothetical protein [Kiritimatiellia bacterium]
MKKISFQEMVEQISREVPRYNSHVYFFMREALDFTIKLFEKPLEGPGRHVSGSELLEGVRKYALQEYGPMAKTVLNRWGIHRCEDFGDVVFIMVEKGVLGKTEEDRKEDFSGGYDFDTAFLQPFRPSRRRADVEAPALSAVP